MRLFNSKMVLDGSQVIALGLILVSQVLAQPPGPGGDRGFGDRGGGRRGPAWMSEPSLSRELRNPDFAAKLKITEEQQQKFNEIDMALREYFRSAPRGPGGPGRGPSEEVLAKLKEFEASAVNVLTPEQKTIWETRAAEIRAENATREAARSGETAASASPTTPAAPAGPPQVAAPQRRMNFTEEKPPEGVTATASFGAKAASSSGASDTAAGSGAPAESKIGADSGVKLSFNFQYAPWTDVLKLFADAANLTLDLNDVPPGTFNYYDDKSYTNTEVLDVLNGYLLPKGYVLIRRDRFLVSLNIDNGIPPSLVPTISLDELPQRGANELIIVDVPVEGMEVDKIVGDLRELLAPWGKMAPVRSTNSLNIMDTGSNIRRIVRLLKSGQAIEGNKETAFRAISLKNINAADAERTVRRLFGLNPVVQSAPAMNAFNPFAGGQPGGFGRGFGGGGFGGGGGGDPRGDNRDPQNQQRFQPQVPVMGGTQQAPSPYLGKIMVTADTRTNHLLVTASSALVKVVEDTVKAIDVPQDTPVVKNESPVTVKAYLVPGGDPTQVAQTLSAIMPGVVAGIDTRASKVYVQGTQEEHVQVDTLMKTLAGEASGSVAVIPLMRLDPVQATNTLRNLFANEARAPSIEADAQGRRLLVRGSADQLAQVKVLLQQLGETGPNSHDDKTDRGPVLRVPLGSHDPNEIMPLIQQIWQAGDRAPIRIVVPSRPSPVRDRLTPSNPRQPAVDGIKSPAEREPATTRPTTRTVPVPRDSSGPSTSLPRKSSFLQVSQSGDSRKSDPSRPRTLEITNREPELKLASDEATSTEQNPESKADSAKVNRSNEKAGSLTITILGGEYVITGGTPEERDQAEEMINTLTSSLPVRSRWTIFYLRSADATETAQMLERLFPQSNVTAAPTSTSGMFGSFTSGLSQLGRGMMNSTGLNQTLGGANNLRIITDTRANALFVTGPQDQISEVEQMLEILDASELPDSLRANIARTIPVEYADVDDIEELLAAVFKDEVTPAAQAQQQQQQNQQRMNPFAALLGGGAQANSPKTPRTLLTVYADRRTSHMVVFCNDTLFRQVESVVKEADERAREARQMVKIVPLATADPTLVQATLSSLMPKITVSSSHGGSRRKRDGSTDPAQTPPQAQQGPDAIMLQRAMQQQQPGGSGGRSQNAGRQNGGSRQSGGGQRGGGQGNGAGTRRSGN